MKSLIPLTLAQIENPIVPSVNKDPVVLTSNVLQLVFSLFMLVGILYFAWHFIFAGYHFINSQGDPKKFEEAKNQITYAFVGLAVVFSVYALLKVIGIIFGIPNLDSLQLELPTL